MFVADEALRFLDVADCPQEPCEHGSNPGPCVVVAGEGVAVCAYCGRCFTWCDDEDTPHTHPSP